MDRQVRLFGRLVRLYPASFRGDYSDEIVRVFADQLRDTRATGSSLAVAELWARSTLDLVVTAAIQRVREDETMPQTVEVGIAHANVTPNPPRRIATVIAAVPLLIWAILSVAVPGFTEPLYMNPPSVIGIPMGILLIIAAALLGLLGILQVRRAHSTTGVAIALVCFTLPASILIALAPTLVFGLSVSDL